MTKRSKSSNALKSYVTGWSRDDHDKRSKSIGLLYNTEILSFLERERDRTVNVFDYSFQSVTETRKFLGVPERFQSFHDVLSAFMDVFFIDYIYYSIPVECLKKVTSYLKRS